MKSVDADLAAFAGEAKPKPARKPRSGYVPPFETKVALPGEEAAPVTKPAAPDPMRHWNALVTTNPDYVKPFNRGGFKGSAISPSWREMRMTEHFGPVGIGWGMERPEFERVPIEENGELLVYCTVVVWYIDNGTRASVYGLGGDKVIARGQQGLRTNDEAYKSALTDALGNAMKRIGVGGDVHLGLFDDDKYVRDAAQSFAPPSEPPPLTKAPFPSPQHVVTLMEIAREKMAGNRSEAEKWWHSLEPEDKEIVKAGLRSGDQEARH